MSCVEKVIVKIDNEVKVKVKLVNFGNRNDVCPIINCIDGGSSTTVVYPPVNGVINGGGS